MSYENRLNTVYTQHLQFKKPSKFWKKRSIPKGQILYHKKNFSKYFGLPIKNFKTKKILETGAGPGVHATILGLMSNDVHAADILAKNLKPIYLLSFNKWYIDELYNIAFIKPYFFLADFFWKKGDIKIIDRYGPNGIAKIINIIGKNG